MDFESFLRRCFFPWLWSEAPPTPLADSGLLEARGANYELHLGSGRLGASGLFEPLHQEEPQTPSTYEVVGLLKNNCKSLIPSQENKILKNNNIMIIIEE